jgi:hypothetical protein
LALHAASADSGYLRVLGDVLNPGASGGPVLDPLSGLVCGLGKADGREDYGQGGWVVPAGAVRDA